MTHLEDGWDQLLPEIWWIIWGHLDLPAVIAVARVSRQANVSVRPRLKVAPALWWLRSRAWRKNKVDNIERILRALWNWGLADHAGFGHIKIVARDLIDTSALLLTNEWVGHLKLHVTRLTKSASVHIRVKNHHNPYKIHSGEYLSIGKDPILHVSAYDLIKEFLRRCATNPLQPAPLSDISAAFPGPAAFVPRLIDLEENNQ